MNKIIATSVLSILVQGTVLAKAVFLGADDMIRDAECIAIVDIQQLTSTDLDMERPDLIATGIVIRTLKGNLEGSIQFSIPRYFPCAQFDVSTGRNLVFLKQVDGAYQGVNWNMSYIHLASEDVFWYTSEGTFEREFSGTDVLKDVQRRIQYIEQGAAANP